MNKANKSKPPPSARFADLGGKVGAIIAIVGIVMYAISDLNPDKGQFFNLKTNLIIAGVTIVFYFLGSIIGHTFRKRIESKEKSREKSKR